VGSVVKCVPTAALNETTLEEGAKYRTDSLLGRSACPTEANRRNFLACRWINTSTGNPLDLPLADDTANDAAVIVESALVDDGPNMQFAQVQFGNTPLWSTKRIKVSLQLAQDSPILVADYLAQPSPALPARHFRTVHNLTAGGADEYGSSSTSTITPDDLFGIMGSLDDAYGSAPVAHDLKTCWRFASSPHESLFRRQRRLSRCSGAPVSLGAPVYICPSLDDIGGRQQAIVLETCNGFIARSAVPSRS